MDMYGLEGSMGSGGGGGAKGSPGGRLPAMYVPSFYFVYTWTGGRGSAPIAGRPRIPNRHRTKLVYSRITEYPPRMRIHVWQLLQVKSV